jgi:hypothetical protein
MADRETREFGGEGIAVFSKGLVSWVFTPVILGECGVSGREGMPFFL